MALYMSYLDDLIRAMPLWLGFGGAMLLILWRIARRRPRAMEAAAAVYLSALLYILFFIADGGADAHNLLPGRCLYIALTYGVGIAPGLLIQFILNLILFLPWGVFAAHFSRGRLLSLPLSALMILLMELIQSRIGRIFDADDVLANTLGAALGFSLYENLYTDRRGRRALELTLMIFIAASGLMIGLAESRKLYGYTDINGNPPEAASLRLEAPLSDTPTRAAVYRLIPQDASSLARRLAEYMGFDAEPELSGDAVRMTDAEGCWLIARTDGNFSLNWPIDEPEQASNLLPPAELWQTARQHLEDMELTGLLPKELSSPAAGVYELRFFLEERNEAHWRFGDLWVRIRDDGALMELNSQVRDYVPLIEAPCLSPAQALRRLTGYPAEEYSPGVSIQSARLIYQPALDGAHLLPCWEFLGTFQGEAWTQSIWGLDYQ